MFVRTLIVVLSALFVHHLHAQLPPIRSTIYDGSAAAGTAFASRVAAPNLDLTIEAWVYREDPSRCETIVAQDYTRSFWLGFCGDSLRFYRNGNKAIDAGRNVTAQRWTHVAVAYDSAAQQARFYIDGALVSTQSSTATNAPLNLPVYLGRTASAGAVFTSTYPFHGALDEVRIWSVARSAAEINGARFLELGGTNTPPGLTAVFPTGGDLEIINNTTVTSQAGTTEQVFGILPRDLIIPRRPVDLVVNGAVTTTEYAGAEMLPVRYMQGTNEVDVAARLMAYGSRTSAGIYVGMSGFRPSGDLGYQNRSEFSFAVGVPDAPTPTEDDFRYSMYYNDTPSKPLVGNGSTWITNKFGLVDGAKAFCEGDLSPPCIEMRAPLPQSDPAMMLELMYAGQIALFNRRFYAPFNAHPNNPQTWPRVTIGDVIGAAQTVRINVKVQEPVAGGEPLPVGTMVRLINSTTLEEITRVGTSATSGNSIIDVRVLTNTPVTVELAAPDHWPRLGARGVPGTGTLPTSTTLGSARFAGCTTCNYADVVFDTAVIPTVRSGPTNLSPNTGNGWIVLRETPSLKQVPPSYVTVFGTNLHSRMSLYLTTCSSAVFNDVATTPWEATGCDESRFWPLGGQLNPERTGFVASLNVSNLPPTSYRIMIRDEAPRASRRQWQYAPGNVTLTLPEYPLIYGWVFRNERDGTQFDEFSGVFQWNAYDCLIPPGIVISPQQTCFGCRIPNPLYLTWYAVFTGWTEAMTGTCLGMAATARLFQLGDLREEDFDSRVHYPFGFKGLPANPTENPLDESRPPKPQEHRFRPCDYSEPVNLWAHIHRNQAVQTSAEFLSSIISQMYGTGIGTSSYSIAGNPNQVLSQLRSGLNGLLLCFQNGSDVVQSHAVVPYQIIDGMRLATNGLAMEPDPDCTIVKIYDPNAPGETNCLFEFNRVSNEYRYVFSFRNVGGVRVPIWWSGTGVYVTPISIWRNARSAPGFDLAGAIATLIFFGSADGTYSEPSGGRWGWDAAGKPIRDYPDAKVWAPSTAREGDYLANQSRSVMFFPPADRKPTDVEINARGKAWSFYAAEAGTITQLQVNDGLPGDKDLLKIARRPDSNLAGLRYTPQRRMTDFKPILGMNLGTNPAVVFSWEGMSLPAGKSIEILARPEQFGAHLLNDASEILRPSLRILRGDTNGLKTNLFGPLEIPIGALQSLTLPQFGSDFLQLDLDLDRDGQPEESATIFAQGVSGQPSIVVRSIQPDQIRLSFAQTADKWTLEYTDELGAKAVWKSETAAPQTSNSQYHYDLPATTAARFYRLKQ